jgi:hypothetical protein
MNNEERLERLAKAETLLLEALVMVSQHREQLAKRQASTEEPAPRSSPAGTDDRARATELIKQSGHGAGESSQQQGGIGHSIQN